MRTCTKCQKLYADNFKSCPNCGGAKSLAGCLVVVAILGVIIWIATGSQNSGEKSAAHWETISGTQQDIFIAMDIDSSSIERTADGSSASVLIKNATNDEVERVTYICPSAPGRSGAVIFNGAAHELAERSTSGQVMRRVCFGPIGGPH